MKKIGTSRRGFLRTAAATGASLGLLGTAKGDAGEGPDASPAPRVPRRTLGATGEQVPILNLGCAQKFDPVYDRILHRAFQEGVDYLDTARVYADGQSHRTIAPFLQQIEDRKKIWITSKEALRSDFSVEGYRKGLDKCLEELETDYLDLYFMHSVKQVDNLGPEYVKMGEALKKSGKTRYFGFSCHGDRVVELLDAAAKSGGFDAIMFRYDFSRYGDVKLNKAMDACVKAGIGLIAMKTQKSVPEEQERVAGFRSKEFTLPQAKLKAVWADERIASICSHMENTQQLADNVAAAKSPVQLSMDEVRQLHRIATATAGFSCRGCSEICEGRVGAPLKIADSLRFLMYYESYRDPVKARKLYAQLSPEERDFDGVDLAGAAEACPQGIDIAARLTRARELLA